MVFIEKQENSHWIRGSPVAVNKDYGEQLLLLYVLVHSASATALAGFALSSAVSATGGVGATTAGSGWANGIIICRELHSCGLSTWSGGTDDREN